MGQISYISFSVLFQTKSSLVWKSNTQKLRRIFQTNSSLVWKEKLILQDVDSKPNSAWFGNFDDHCQGPENSKPNSVWFGIIIDFCQRLEPSTNPSFIAHLSLPWSIGWVSLSFLVCSSRYGNTRPNLTSSCPTPPNPYIFWKLMIIAIQKWIRNTNTKTKTNTKTMTKTKTPRE